MEEKQASRECICRPGEPTSAAPGSPRKIRVLMERAARREPLFHPLDGIRRRSAETGPARAPQEASADLAGGQDQAAGQEAGAPEQVEVLAPVILQAQGDLLPTGTTGTC
jgi:hypothetical protein